MRVGVGIAVALSGLTIGCDQPQSTRNEQAETARSDEADSVIRRLTADPQFTWFSTLQGLFPSDYATVQNTLRTEITDADNVVSARIAMAEVVKPIMARHKETAILASDKELVEYLRRNTLVAEALAGEDAKACTDVFRGALDPRTDLSNGTWKLMSEATAQLLIASKDGETVQVRRSDNGLSKKDYAAWRVEMEKVGADVDTFDLLTNPARKAAATDKEKCRVRVQMMRGALGLPEELAARILLNVLR